jgi:predicted phage-related endonuclease
MVSKVTPDTMLSASRLPAVMGLSKYRSANDELIYSINALQGGEREDISNESMDWGNQLEPLILKEAARRLELADLVLDHPEPRFHDALPLCCSLDGTGMGTGQVISTDTEKGIYVVGQDSIVLDGMGVLEAKLTAVKAEDSPPLWRGPVQLQAQMDIVKAKWGCVATLYQGTELRLFLFAPHEDTLDAIDRACTVFQKKLDFWKETGGIDYYAPQDSKDADRVWPKAVEELEPLPLGHSVGEWAQKILANKEQMARLQSEIDKHETKIKELMKDNGMAIAGDYQIKWGMRSYCAQPEKVVPAKPAYVIRQSTLTIKKASPVNAK